MFNPDDGPARLFRYVEVMPLPHIIALFFARENLLLIDRELFDMLNDDQRRRVLRTEDKVLEISFPPNKPPIVMPRNC